MSVRAKEHLVPRTCAALLVATFASFVVSIALLPTIAWAYTVEVTDINGNSLGDTVDVNTLSQGIIVHVYSREPGMISTIYDDVGRRVSDGYTILEIDDSAWGNFTIWLSLPNPKPGMTYTLYLAGVYGGGSQNGVQYDPTYITFTAGGGQEGEGDNGTGSGGNGNAEGGSPKPENTGTVLVVGGGNEVPGETGAIESGDNDGSDSTEKTGDDGNSGAITGEEVGDEAEESGTDPNTLAAATETNPSNRENPEEHAREEASAPTQQAQSEPGPEGDSPTAANNDSPAADLQGESSSSPAEGDSGGEASLGSKELQDSSKRGLVYHVAQVQEVSHNETDLNHAGNYQIDISGLPYIWVVLCVALGLACPTGIAHRIGVLMHGAAGKTRLRI